MGCASSSTSNSSDESSSYGLYLPHRLTSHKRKFTRRASRANENNYAKAERCDSSSSSSGWSGRSTSSPTSVQQQSERVSQHSTLVHSYVYCSSSTSTDELHDSSCNSMPGDTQDISKASVEISNAPQSEELASDVEMKMFPIMANTSSPIAKRRNVPVTNYSNYTPPSDIYCYWRKCLHEPPSKISNITHLPEAVAGQFGHSGPCVPLAVVVPGYGVVRCHYPIESTEL